MAAKLLLVLFLVAALVSLIEAGGHGGGHKKVIIHVPYKVKHHHHTHTIVKHIHHKEKGGGGGDDHYEVLGYTYGQPKAAPHFGGGHGYGAAEEHDSGHDAPVSFEGGDSSYGLSAAGEEHSSYGGEEHGY